MTVLPAQRYGFETPAIRVARESSRIVIVEDEFVVAMDLEQSLMDIGYHVVGIAAEATEALRLVETTSPDLVLMDIHLHGATDGIDVADQIRRRWHIPVVFVTAYVNAATVDRAAQAQPFGYIAKPCGASELSAVVEVALHQHRVAQELFSENTWFTSMLAGLSDGVIATDAQGRVTYLNALASKITGWSLQEARGCRISEIYSVLTLEGRPLDECRMRSAVKTRQTLPRERFLLVDRSGDRIHVEDTASPIEDAQGHCVGCVLTFLDVTERYEAEQARDRLTRELQRSNEDLARFSYAVAHDLSAPVRTVRGLAELLKKRIASGFEEDPNLLMDLIINASGGMQRLIESLLEYAQAGRGQLTIVELKVAEVVNTVKARLDAAIVQTHARIRCDELPVVVGDQVQLEQLFQNLLMNAMLYRRPGIAPEIVISSRTFESYWRFSVQDNGEGIPQDRLQQIFEPLKRLHGSQIPGTGLGLALCQTIVDRHGGTIWVESDGPGTGSTFHFTLRKL